MSQFVGSTDHRLFADWNTWISEPNHIWSAEAKVLAARGLSLVSNDPFAAAMVSAKLRETHGPTGMVLRSTYSEKDVIQTTTEERNQRRAIEASIRHASAGRQIDASGGLTRVELERALDWTATIMGDCFAVRLWRPERRNAYQATCWRLVMPNRVSNPSQAVNNLTIQDGIEFNLAGEATAIYVEKTQIGSYGTINITGWDRIPMVADDGSRNVIHRVGMRVPGMVRGISMFAPALLLMRQIQGTVEAHVAGKRAQAIHPIIYFTEDEEELKASITAKARLGQNAVLGPMSVLVAKYGASDVKFMTSSFQGADLRDFLTTMYRSLSAMWGLPWQVVLCEMGEASLASARAGLDQNDRTCQGYQEDHQAQVSRVMDEAIIREEVARDRLTFGTDDWTDIMAGRYSRPPKYSTDRQKDSVTIKNLIETGVSPTTAFAMFGLDYEDEAEQTARDIEFAEGQGLPDPTAKPVPGGQAPFGAPMAIPPTGEDKPADEQETDLEADEKPAEQPAGVES